MADNHSLEADLNRIYADCFALVDLSTGVSEIDLQAVYVLIVSILVKLHILQGFESSAESSNVDQKYLIQAACLLEFFQGRLPEDRQIFLLKIRVYLLLGLPALAMSVYPKLQIRDFLIDTMSHEIYTRISGNLPFHKEASAPQGDDSDHVLGLGDTVDFYSQWHRDLSNYLLKIKDSAVHGLFADIVQMIEKRRRSFTMRMLWIEKRRSARMRDQEKELGNVNDIGRTA